MVQNSFEKLIEEANTSIPFYTSHLEKLRGFIDYQKKITEHLLKINPQDDLEEFKEIEQMNKFNALLTISLLDLLVVCKNLCLVKEDWERIYFIKQAYLIIYETIRSFKRYNSFLHETINNKYPSFNDSYKSINVNLKLFKKEHDYNNWIELVRNKIAGHIDDDFVLYYATIAKMNGENVSVTIFHFLKILMQLQMLSKDIVSLAKSETEMKSEQLNTQIIENLKSAENILKYFESV